MKNVLLLNGGKVFAHSHGRLNDSLHDAARETFGSVGCAVQQTKIDAGYETEAEIEKYLWADLIVYQFPGWWMGLPWVVKKYIDEVFTQGHGRLYSNDGRTRSDPNRKYGSGGWVHGKFYMVSTTWNAPEESFTDPEQFFGGVGIDGVLLPVHKANQFLGMTGLPTFLATDVMKNPHVDDTLAAYRDHILKVVTSTKL